MIAAAIRAAGRGRPLLEDLEIPENLLEVARLAVQEARQLAADETPRPVTLLLPDAYVCAACSSPLRVLPQRLELTDGGLVVSTLCISCSDATHVLRDERPLLRLLERAEAHELEVASIHFDSATDLKIKSRYTIIFDKEAAA